MEPNQPIAYPSPHDVAFEVGIYSFAELTADPVTGVRIGPA